MNSDTPWGASHPERVGGASGAWCALGALMVVVAACGDGGTKLDAYSDGAVRPPADARAVGADGAVADASAPDGSALDGSAPDGSAPDGSAPDGSAPDGSAPDGSAPDASAPDGSAPDAGIPDATIPDASPPDAAIAHVCAITHNGGAPGTVSSLHVTPAGDVTLVDTVTLAADDGAGVLTPLPSNAIAACGDSNLFVALRGGGVIAHVGLAYDGTLSPGPTTALAGVRGVLCDPSRGLLIAVGTPVDGTATVPITSFGYASDGTLSWLDSATITAFVDETTTFTPGAAHMVVHPDSGDLWVVGYFTDVTSAVAASRAARVRVLAGGTFDVAEVKDIGAGASASRYVMRSDGNVLYAAALNSGCEAAWAISGTNRLPADTAATFNCGGDFGGGIDVAARTDGSGIIYHPTAELLRVAELATGALSHRSSLAAAGSARLVSLAYEEALLIAAAPDTGAVGAFPIAVDNTTLSAAGSADAPSTTLRGLVVMPCRP